ncbi:malectin domain-containing carbohydrate-binding protein [Sphingomonas sp. MS122]|uniref:malectin domain-containing carbohydrate-binding protein n=1 Tax=Sphingomonas sp. MS122 TaxID=3412683 RepID=UPI003C2DF64E
MPLGAVARILAVLALFWALPATAGQSEWIAGAWQSIVLDDGAAPAQGYEQPGFDDRSWTRVAVPHNWQGYSYNRQLRVGARHGVAWYRKQLRIAPPRAGERIAIRFEGANSYATVWLNGRRVGRHGGGLTGFAVDVTDAVVAGDNLLAVRIDHPAGITDLPWVSGDDQPENGFAEGSQPFGIFRPVHVERSSALRVRPHGSYAWGKEGAITAERATLTTRVELENRASERRTFTLETALIDPKGRVVAQRRSEEALAAGHARTVEADLPPVAGPQLWSPDRPVLHTLRVRILANGREIDRQETATGIRTIRIVTDEAGQRRLLVNGKPVFLRGVAEYEHLLGGSHAFSDAQVAARVAQARAAGFNAFRDAHYPHNLRYGDAVARAGMMWWPQFSAHIWFDNPAFRANFRALLEDWVRERRNNPAIFLWGLQNESRLPKAFAQEMVAVIRGLDPTASVERLVVTCNGGEGTDWDVPQNWSGTYGGDPKKFGEELTKQGLVGEYGGWRSLELHDEAPHGATPPTSENHFAELMQIKARLAESVRDRAIGHFQWLLATHENPGRPMRADGTQIWDGVRALDHIGPSNNKGLMTLWGEPLDAYYMYRARNVPASAPMVYIVSHSWPDRWRGPGQVSGIEVYSNCAAVELFNDVGARISLGRHAPDREGRFRWNDVPLRYNVLSAACIEDGRIAARDRIVLNNLPPAPDAEALTDKVALTASAPGFGYVYRVNVGGDTVSDAAGNRWAADRQLAGNAGGWGWRSWAEAYPGLDPMLGSRRRTFDPIAGTDAPALFQDFRYGRDQLGWRFPVPDGRYRVELYFAEPWYGRAGIDARGWRVFDVAINGRTVIDDLDIFAEAGFGRALRKVVEVDVRGGAVEIGFPEVKAGQAVLSAIAIATRGGTPVATEPGSDLIAPLPAGSRMSIARFVDNGAAASAASGAPRWTGLPPALLDSDQLTPAALGRAGITRLTVRHDAVLHAAIGEDMPVPAGWRMSDARAWLMGERLQPVRFVTRTLGKGETVEVPETMPVLVRRVLPSPYAPGNFTFAKDRSLHEAEDEKVRLESAARASSVRGHSGPGYVAVSGRGTISWTIETGAAGKRQMQLRFQSPGVARAGRIALRDSSGIVVATMPVAFAATAGEWSCVTVATPGFVNAGTYAVTLSTEEVLIDSLKFE